MGVKVPKEIQEIDLLTLRLRTEGSAPIRGGGGGGRVGGGGVWGRGRRKHLSRNTVEPLYDRDGHLGGRRKWPLWRGGR